MAANSCGDLCRLDAQQFGGFFRSEPLLTGGQLLAGPDAATELGESLASAQIEVRGEKDVAPDNVGAASESGLIAGDIRVDRNNGRAAWLWLVGDNLRLTADGAADLVSALAGEWQ